MALRMFIHGLESNNQGTKAVYFRKNFPGMLTPNFPGSLDERMAKLRALLSEKSDILLVGSSFGGLMASIFAVENEPRVKRLVLLAPAINLMEFTPYRERKLQRPVHLYHGRQDEVIPLEDVQSVARQVFPDLSFHTVDDDHYLHKTFEKIEWDALLS
ncbi:MAG: alpha/beta hydrolase [Deltaproteobacteria bacterium]|jgi:pimeloyl-ACP methyl ester carboxylesterase|nr:alpha/beta hydrolase [Deltaproteobacteria bacterium]NTV57721.1 alpha/beta hydrolase [Deltaproteobacteria bacterium]